MLNKENEFLLKEKKGRKIVCPLQKMFNKTIYIFTNTEETYI